MVCHLKQMGMNVNSIKRNENMIISVANSRKTKTWKNIELSWEQFLEKVKVTRHTAESMAEYRKMSKLQQDDLKDIGGYLGGSLKDGKRRGANVEYRSLLTLDLDYAPVDFWEDFTCLFDYKACIYSTHKHTPDKPRLRLILPLARNVSCDEYVAISRLIAKDIDIEYFDDTTYQPQRLMYWPSTSCDAEFIFEHQDGPIIDPDYLLSRYKDWHDTREYPVSSRQSVIINKAIAKQSDPLAKEGMVGSFCRAYGIEVAISEFLSDIYEPSTMEGRYDYIPADSSSGVVVYDDKFCFSNHATDPACGKLCNAFDLVRIHKFGDLDIKIDDETSPGKRPSFQAMQELCIKDDGVKKQLAIERTAQANEDFITVDEDWQTMLAVNKKGDVENTLKNLIVILENDEFMKNIVFNQLLDGMEIKGSIPWQHPSKYWRDADDAQLTAYIDSKYGTFSKQNYLTAITKVTDDRSYHPVKKYLDALPEWDNVQRLEILLIEYLGANDNDYTRQVTRKVICAAVARIYKPGIKFDPMLVLVGAQGIGKSTLFAKLGRDWYSDSLSIADMKDKTGAEKLQGCWLVEVSELAGIRKVESETVRSFVSRQDDKYRASYGRRVEPHPRQCILVGSTNAQAGFLRDLTGNRRFLPVNVGVGNKKVWDMTSDDVDLIWSEVLHYVKAGESLDIPDSIKEIAVEEQRKALESDDREGLIIEYMNMLLPDNWDSLSLMDRRNFIHNKDFGTPVQGTLRRQRVCPMEIWSELFCKDAANLKKIDSYEINAMLSKIDGWEKAEKLITFPLYGRQRGYILEQDEQV